MTTNLTGFSRVVEGDDAEGLILLACGCDDEKKEHDRGPRCTDLRERRWQHGGGGQEHGRVTSEREQGRKDKNSSKRSVAP